MKHKTLSLYVPCLDGGCEDAGRVDLAGYTLISDKRLYDLEAAEQDAIEQARLNGMGSEREAALMAQLEAAEKERDFAKVEISRLRNDINELTGERDTYKAAYNEWIAKTEWVQDELTRSKLPAKYLGMHRADGIKVEIDTLRAKIEQMERQKPVATIHINSITGNPSVDFIPGHRYLHHNSSLYALPGAKGEEK